MAQGTITLFTRFSEVLGEGGHNLSSDSFKVMLIDNTVVATASDANADASLYTEVSGTNYTAGGQALTMSWDKVSNTMYFNVTSGSSSWTSAAGAPTNIYQAIVYNTTTTEDNAVGFVDMTVDGGVTPLNLASAGITMTYNPALFRVASI